MIYPSTALDLHVNDREKFSARTSSPRVGAVSYLNSKPLIEELSDDLPAGYLQLDYPSRLAEDLARGNLDVALIPSVEYFSNPDYRILSDACVATHGPVLSVKLFSRVPLWEIQTLSLDEGSRTSAALVKVMLQERFGVTPDTTPLPLTHSTRDSQSDAVLLIGDRAIHPPAEEFFETWDLGEEWVNWTGLPFVFAMWVARSRVEDHPLQGMLESARDRGLSRLDQIADREAPILNLSASAARTYLRKNLHFQLGPAERQGLELFRQLVHQLEASPIPG